MQVILDSSFARPVYGAGRKESSGTGLGMTAFDTVRTALKFEHLAMKIRK